MLGGDMFDCRDKAVLPFAPPIAFKLSLPFWLVLRERRF